MSNRNPTISLVTTLPDAVRRVALPTGYKISGTLRAEFPPPYGAVYLRYATHADNNLTHADNNLLEVITPSGTLLQHLVDTAIKVNPAFLHANPSWLAPQNQQEQKGPVIAFRQELLAQDKKPYQHEFRLSFPDGFSHLCTLSDWPTTGEKGEPQHVWNGLGFVEETEEGKPDADDFSPPTILPKPRQGTQTRFGATVFGTSRYLLRWTRAKSRHYLEISDANGRFLCYHRLRDDFGTDKFTTLGALWLDDKRKQDPIVLVRDSDQVRLHVFSEGFTRLLCVQDFNDSSSSIAATTVNLGRTKQGILTITESYSERGDEEGKGGDSHETDYVWDGRRFTGSK